MSLANQYYQQRKAMSDLNSLNLKIRPNNKLPSVGSGSLGFSQSIRSAIPSVSSSSSKGSTYSNLPTFVNSNVMNQSTATSSIRQASSDSTNLPFVPRDSLFDKGPYYSNTYSIGNGFTTSTRVPSLSSTISSTTRNDLFNKQRYPQRPASAHHLFRNFTGNGIPSPPATTTIDDTILMRKGPLPLSSTNTFDSSGPGSRTIPDDGLDPETEFLNFLKCITIISLQLGKKGFVWVVYFLSMVASYLLKIIDEIPNPKRFEEVEEELPITKDTQKATINSTSIASKDSSRSQSTPIVNKNKDHEGVSALLSKLVPTSFSTPLVELEDEMFQAPDDTPLYSKISKNIIPNKNKISELASKLQEKDPKEDDKQSPRKNSDIVSLRNQPSIATQISQGKHYGSFFFKPSMKSSNDPDIEAMFLKTTYSLQNGGFKPYKPDVEPKTTSTSSILNVFSAPMKDNDSNRALVNRPAVAFNRGTNRFKDMEWLKNDKEDYVNNLEATSLFKEYQKIAEERTKMQDLIKLTKLKEEGLLRPLTHDQASLVEEFWESEDQYRNVVTAFNIDISVRDLKTLADRRWLNDNIIDFYTSLVKQRSELDPSLPKIHVFSTHFYSTLCKRGYEGVKKWAKRAKVDVTKLDYIFVPVNLNQSHWVLAVINNKEKCFQYYDSLYGSGDDVLYRLEDYMNKECKKLYNNDAKAAIYDSYDHYDSMKAPKQQNGFDCGVFTCTAVDYISREKPLLYSQNDMGLLRRRMAYEIYLKKMLPR